MILFPLRGLLMIIYKLADYVQGRYANGAQLNPFRRDLAARVVKIPLLHHLPYRDLKGKLGAESNESRADLMYREATVLQPYDWMSLDLKSGDM